MREGWIFPVENLLLQPAAEPFHCERFIVSICQLISFLVNADWKATPAVLLPKYAMRPLIAGLTGKFVPQKRTYQTQRCLWSGMILRKDSSDSVRYVYGVVVFSSSS